MIRKKINQFEDWLEHRLRMLIGPLSFEARFILVLTMLLGFTALSLYVSISAVYNFGKNKGEKYQIEHIRQLELDLDHKQHELDSINRLNNFHYEQYERNIGE